MEKTPIDRDHFMAVLNDCGYSLRSLYKKWTVPPCSNRQLRRYLLDGYIPPKVLYDISDYIGVAPEQLSGYPIREVNAVVNTFIDYCNANYGFVAGVENDKAFLKRAAERIILGGE